MKQNKAPIFIRLFCMICCISLLSSCQKISEPAAEELLLPDTLPLEFIFASGAGAWRTSLTLNQDGSFEGAFSDSEMGETGEGYPHGSVYFSNFSGQFNDIALLDDNTYSMTLSEINFSNRESDAWIEDEIRYVAADPYGLEEGREFLFYTPEVPLENLSEDFLSWWPDNYLRDENALETLSRYGLYNKKMGYGFFSVRED